MVPNRATHHICYEDEINGSSSRQIKVNDNTKTNGAEIII